MIDAHQLRTRVIQPTLQRLDLWSPVAETLLVATAAHESKMGTYLHQLNGPARGIYQIEPATHKDIWENFLKYRSGLAVKIRRMIPPASALYDPDWGQWPEHQMLTWDLAYATAIARIVYLRVPKRLPETEDIWALADYWKLYYNTPKGKGTVEQFVTHFSQYAR